MQLRAEDDNCVDQSNLAPEKFLHLRSGNCSHITEFYVQSLPKLDVYVDKLNLASKKLLHLKIENFTHMADIT